MSASYLRCGHCRGFYELALSHCRYCGKDVPLKGADGTAKVFVDRETCRAIQIAEYEQLPEEAHKDCMRPDPELLGRLCGCLHCGPEGGLFEAVEMRWMANERMWACPCTTCGGRGFTFDIHLAEPLWQCAECRHWYDAPADDRRRSAAKCPKCGSTEASGWFDDEEEDDEYDEEEESAMEAGMIQEADEEASEEVPVFAENKPWEPDEDDGPLFSPEPPHAERMRDDIDFPHPTRAPRDDTTGEPLSDDDIPW
jgi:hypothetical protein